MDEDNPITQAFGVEAVERLIEQVRKDRDFFRNSARVTRAWGYPSAERYDRLAAEADATLRAVLGEEGGG